MCEAKAPTDGAAAVGGAAVGGAVIGAGEADGGPHKENLSTGLRARFMLVYGFAYVYPRRCLSVLFFYIN